MILGSDTVLQAADFFFLKQSFSGEFPGSIDPGTNLDLYYLLYYLLSYFIPFLLQRNCHTNLHLPAVCTL